jgi:hypothetical protein
MVSIYDSKEYQGTVEASCANPPISQENVFTPWEYGVALKQGRRLFLLWASIVESYLIDGCDYINQLHFHAEQDGSVPMEEAAVSPRAAVVVLSHGFSDIVGPAYALIQCLAGFLRANGYQVIIPDYRPRYVFH